MEEEDEEGAPTQGIGGVERRGLVDIVSNPHVMTAYHKWAANQGTAKKAPFWGFFEELKKAVGM